MKRIKRTLLVFSFVPLLFSCSVDQKLEKVADPYSSFTDFEGAFWGEEVIITKEYLLNNSSVFDSLYDSYITSTYDQQSTFYLKMSNQDRFLNLYYLADTDGFSEVRATSNYGSYTINCDNQTESSFFQFIFNRVLDYTAS